MKKYLLLGYLLMTMSGYLYSQIRYVTEAGAGLKNGTSWADAYDGTRLQTAVDAGSGQVWVAAGTYYPGSFDFGPFSSHRYDNFNMANGVAIYGGFNGTETLLSQRNWTSNMTVLSGDIGTPGVKTDNCQWVISNYSSLNGTAILDGFTVTGGYNADQLDYSGAGIVNYNASPTISNCRIVDNAAAWGGGVLNYQSTATFVNCLIAGNSATRYGGGILSHSTSNLSPILINCTITGNTTGQYAGGVVNEDETSSTTLYNCVIWGNTTVLNTGNQIDVAGGTMTLTNCCFANGGDVDVYLIGPYPDYATGIITTSACIFTDPLFLNAAGGDYRIPGNSPCADTGDNSFNSEATDIRSGAFSRQLSKVDGTAGTIDMGAYEYKFGTDPAGNYIWTGASSDAWTLASNWNPTTDVPSTGNTVTIPDVDNDPIISTTGQSCKDLTIEPGAVLTINAGADLTVSGTLANAGGSAGLVLKSTASGTGSLIAGTAAGQATAERYMTTGAWHMVASPLAGQPISGFLTANANVATNGAARGMMDYNAATNVWNGFFTNATGGSMGTGQGFSMRSAADGIVTFTGVLRSGAQSATTVADMWNCVGNPYTSAIYINVNSNANNFITENALTNSNIDPLYGVYVWDKTDASNGVTGNYTAISNASAAFEVQQGQAFFVKMNPAKSSVAFTPVMQVQNSGLALKSAKTVWPTIKLVATAGDQKSSTVIAFNSGMTTGLDLTYDAGLLKGSADLAIYTRLVEDYGIPFAIQALPENQFNNMVIPVGIDSKTGGNVVFSSELFNLPSDCMVILEDKLNKTFTNLSKNVYTTSVAANSSISDRFQLHTSYLTTGLDYGQLSDQLSAFAIRNTEIRVQGTVGKQSVATLYDIQGRVVLIKNLQEGTLNVIPTPNIKSGIYMLYVKDSQKVQGFKIPVKE